MKMDRYFAAVSIGMLALGTGILALGVAPGQAQDRRDPGKSEPSSVRSTESRLGVPSPDSENEDGEADPRPQRQLGFQAMRGRAPLKAAMPLKAHPKAQKMVDKFLEFLKEKEINVALVGGEKYMVNSCLGLKASVGEFYVRLANPSFRWDGNTLEVKLEIERISMNALRVRVRPNVTNPTKLCHFSKQQTIGGSASRVRLEYRCTPRIDVGMDDVELGEEDLKVRIGGLNLKPLQNDLDGMAKNMIEDAMTNFLRGYMPGAALRAIRAYLKSEAAKS
jgi:hypothetical protein